MDKWKAKTLGEVTSYIAKGIPPKYVESETENTIRVLNQKCNRDFRISYADSRLHDSSLKAVPQEKMLISGDVLINSTGTGTAGRVAQIWDVSVPTTIDGHMILMRPTEEVDVLYYGYAIKSHQKAIESYAEGSTGQTEINKVRLQNEIIIQFPADRNVQRKIGKLLANLDEKIIENERINKNLEQQAQAVFKSWFVDFEPFSGIMPDNWRITTFGDVCYNQRERTLSNDYTVFSAVNTGELQPSTEYFTKQVFSKDISNYLKVPQKAFAYNPARVNIGSIGLNIFDYDGCVSPVYVVFTVEDNYEAYFNYIIKTPSFKEEVKTRASGSVRQSLNYRDLALIELTYPDKQTAKRFNDFFWFIHSVKRKISKESSILIELRDTLLPKLMSGELDVSNLDI